MANIPNKPSTPEDVLNMISALNDLFDGSGRIFNQYHHEPAANSPAAQELKNFAKPVLVNDVHYRGILSMEAAGDHLVAYTTCLSEPAKTLAPATCIRGLLESCALAAWFLDPTIDVQTRVGRCFAFRYAGFVQQIKIFQVEKKQAEIDQVQQRLLKVEQDALSLGYSQLLNSKGTVNGIAQHMPNITELIGQTLDREVEYRLLSGVAHGHHWAIQQLGFQEIEVQSAGGQVIKALEKHLHPNVALYFAFVGVLSFARVIWYLWRLYGWDLKEVEDLLDTTCNRLRIKRELRFWH